MSVMSRLSVSASILDHAVKLFLRSFMLVNTVAATGSDETDAAPLTAGKNMVTGADGATGVILPKTELDMTVDVVNTVSNQDLLVYPASGQQINALTATTGAFTVSAGTKATFYVDVLGHWYTAAANVTTGVATTATTGELNALDGATSANDTTGKAAILDTDGALIVVGPLTLGGTVIGATAAEINTAADQSAQTETLVADGAISVTKRITKIEDTGTGAYTLAAPNAALLGMVKIIEMTVDNGDITVALANVDGAAGNTTATFANVGEHIALVAGVSKWLYLNGTATLS